LNDLWKYDTVSGEWAWLSGSGNVTDFGHYGQLNVSSTDNNPPSRELSIGWINPIDQSFWVLDRIIFVNSFRYLEEAIQIMNY
jgi:hypothetical protein